MREDEEVKFSHPMVWKAVIGLSGVLTLSSCQKELPRTDFPPWYKEIGFLKGVNLPHLYPDSGWDELSEGFVSHSTFQSNLKDLGIRSVRVPISWSSFADAEGQYTVASLRKGARKIELLIQKMEPQCRSSGIVSSGGEVRSVRSLPASAQNLRSFRNPGWSSMEWNALLEKAPFELPGMNRKIANRAEAPAISPTPVPRQERCMVILDFHQFKFGGACGGDGVPALALKGLPESQSLNLNDRSCFTRGWWHFWNDTQSVRTRWIDFSTEFMRVLSEENKVFSKYPWITLAIDPLNEPFPGRLDPIIPFGLNSMPAPEVQQARYIQAAIMNYGQWVMTEMPAQIPRLISFYREYLQAMERKKLSSAWAQSLMLFEPFWPDYQTWNFSKGVFLGRAPAPGVIYAPKGDYSEIKTLQRFSGQPVYWMAAPHQYQGAEDLVLVGNFPVNWQKSVRFNEFPNPIHKVSDVISRLSAMESHFRSLGMETMIGEYAITEGISNIWKANENYEGFSFTRDTPAWQAWITLNSVVARIGLKGTMWWRYVQDRPEMAPKEDQFYLLRGNDRNGKRLPYEQQVLKCRNDRANRLDLGAAAMGFGSNSECPANARP